MRINIFIICVLNFVSLSIYSQVRIGSIDEPNTESILDLTNSKNLGLALDTADNISSSTIKPEGYLFFHSNDRFMNLSDGTVNNWNALSPWSYKGILEKGISFPYTSGVGIGLSVRPSDENMIHIDLNALTHDFSKQSSLLIGDVKDSTTNLTYAYMLMDNDEILVRENSGNSGTLKLQEMRGADVQIGFDTTTITHLSLTAELNVYGKVQENGGDIMPRGTIIMYYDVLTGRFDPLTGTGISNMTGWALCDGRSHTFNTVSTVAPDLNGRFIVGAGQRPQQTRNAAGTAISDVGTINFPLATTGGYDEVAQASAEVAIHFHAKGTLATDAGTSSHTHKHAGSQLDDGGSSNLGSDVGCCCTEGDGISMQPDFDNSTKDTGTAHSHVITGSLSKTTIPVETANIPRSTAVYYLIKL